MVEQAALDERNSYYYCFREAGIALITKRGAQRCTRYASMEKFLYKELTHKIIGYAIEVHKYFGPGILESVYEDALCYELRLGKFFLRGSYILMYVTKIQFSSRDLRLIYW